MESAPARFTLDIYLGLNPGPDIEPANRARRRIEALLGRLAWDVADDRLRARAYWRHGQPPLAAAVVELIATAAWAEGYRPLTIEAVDTTGKRRHFALGPADCARLMGRGAAA
jgi:hypothetical protein